MIKPKIFITIDWFDPAYKAGGPVTSMVNMIEGLHLEFDFYVLCGSRDYGNRNELDLKKDCWTNWRDKAHVYYLSQAKKSRKNIFAIMDDVDCDFYYIQGLFSLYFSIYPLLWWKKFKVGQAVVAPRGMLHETALGIKYKRKRIFLKTIDFLGWYNDVYFHSTNAGETQQIAKALGKERHIREAANFPKFIENKESKEKNTNLNILCVSRISPEKNSLFFLHCLAKSKESITVNYIGGYMNKNYFEQFQKQLEQLPQNIDFKYWGEKDSKELGEFYKISDVFVLPTLGENFGHAIVEALQWGLPVIISNNTPWRNLEPSRAGFDIALNENDFIEKIEFFAKMSNEEWKSWSNSARDFILSQLNLSTIKRQYLTLFS